jgi:hypothetical protein
MSIEARRAVVAVPIGLGHNASTGSDLTAREAGEREVVIHLWELAMTISRRRQEPALCRPVRAKEGPVVRGRSTVPL